jgi:hypothetical protein
VLSSNAVDRGFEPRSGQTKDYKICCFSGKHTTLRRKSKDWLARNQDNVSEWGDMSIRRLLFQWTSTIKIQLSSSQELLYSGTYYWTPPWCFQSLYSSLNWRPTCFYPSTCIYSPKLWHFVICKYLIIPRIRKHKSIEYSEWV